MKVKEINSLVSIVSINYNTTKYTLQMIRSVLSSSYSNIEIIIVDNASSTNDVDMILQNFPQVKLIKSNENLGFSGGNNLGINAAKGDFIFLLNNDTEISKNCIEDMLGYLKAMPQVGVVSPKIKYFNTNVIQYAGSTEINKFTLRNKHVGHKMEDDGTYDTISETPYAHGAAMMFKKALLDRVGELPEKYFLYYEEVDWSVSVRSKGYKIMYLPMAEVYHKESMSVGKLSLLKLYYLNRNRLLFARRNFKGIELFITYLYMLFISFPKNIISLMPNFDRISTYFSAIVWNLSKEKINLKPF